MSKSTSKTERASAASEPEPETTKCPIHKRTIELVQQGKKLVGVCRCDVPDNKWDGQVVIEMATETEE